MTSERREESIRPRHNAEILLVGKNGELILQQRDNKPGITNPGLVTTFGGGLEDGETDLEAAFRELHEETSLEIPIDHFVRYGDYWKTKKVHGEDWRVTYFVVNGVDYTDMKVYEGERYVVIKERADLDKYKTSVLFHEFIEDWYSGWRDFLFMPEPPQSVVDEIVGEFARELSSTSSSDSPLVFCPVGQVGSGKTSTLKPLLSDLSMFTISSDRVRTAIYDKGYNFIHVIDEVILQLLDRAIEKRVDIFFDSNAGSKLDLVRHIEKAGYGVVVFYIDAPDHYIVNKLENISWDNVPERFTFFKEPKHVLASYRSNRHHTFEANEKFMSIYPPNIVIDPEYKNAGLAEKVKDLIRSKRNERSMV